MSYPVYSYSKWNTFKQCPRKYKFQVVDGLPRSPAGPAAQRGTEIHNSVEALLKGEGDELHPEIEQAYGDYFRYLRDNFECVPEMKFAFNRAFQVCEFDDPNALVRGIIDLAIIPSPDDDQVDFQEFKTGRMYDDHFDQRYLYGLYGLLKYPHCTKAQVTGVYFDQGKNIPHMTERHFLGEHILNWEKVRFGTMDKAHDTGEFEARPNVHCRWCDFSHHKGGPCDAG